MTAAQAGPCTTADGAPVVPGMLFYTEAPGPDFRAWEHRVTRIENGTLYYVHTDNPSQRESFQQLEDGPLRDLFATKAALAAQAALRREELERKKREKPGPKTPDAFRFDRIDSLELKPPQWLVPNILEQDAIAIWFGDPASYKTFLTVDLGMRIAAGMDYHGHGDCEQGAVVYLAGEGHNGFARRVHAWCHHHKVDIAGLPFYKSRRAGDFTNAESRDAMLAAVAAALKDAAGIDARLFVVDTLARNLGGDENSNGDINALFGMLNTMQAALPGITILIVAHPGHSDPHRPRGASSLIGNTDIMAKVKATGDLSTALTSKKMKDAPDFEPQYFDLIELRLEADGESFTSLVPLRGEAPVPDESLTKEDQLKRDLLQALASAQDAGEASPGASALPDKVGASRSKVQRILKGFDDEGLTDGQRAHRRLTVAGRGALLSFHSGG